VPAPAERIWLPGSGVTDLAAVRVDRAVNEYDEQLHFGRNEDTGQWCIFLIRRGEAPLPVLGFNDIPYPDDALKRLYQADAMRRGEEILDQMNRDNDKLREKDEEAVKQGIGIAAEAFEWGFRAMGSDKAKRIVVPMGRRGSEMGGWS
jgi:hypothetical protein